MVKLARSIRLPRRGQVATGVKDGTNVHGMLGSLQSIVLRIPFSLAILENRKPVDGMVLNLTGTSLA